MSPIRLLTAAFLSTAGACCWVVEASAADLIVSPGVVEDTKAQLPAVSGINGKWELDPGILTGAPQLRAAGSLSLPLGDRFGLQGDGMLDWSGGGVIYGGALHAFTRDPERYLAGLTAGIVTMAGTATIGAVGPEAELYLDQFSFEGWAGLAAVNYVDPAILDKTGVFAMGDIAYYATPDWRFTAGGSYVLGDAALHLGTEYLFHNFGTPLSLTADTRIHGGGNYTFTIGIKGYFGGNDDGKSLIDRQRQDDPRNRVVDLFGAAQGVLTQGPPGTPVIDSEQACRDAHGDYDSDTQTGWLTLGEDGGVFFGECFVDGEIVYDNLPV